MKLSRKKIALIGLVIVALLALPFIARYLLDSRESPKQQLDKLAIRTNKEVINIMNKHKYSVDVTERRCANQGQGEFFAFGRDTVWCTYSANINSELSGKELRQLVETAGWRHLHVYDDGSGSDYRKKDAPLCFLSDGKTYHSRKELETTYVDGLLILNCQSFTDHYNSPLPSPPSSFD